MARNRGFLVGAAIGAVIAGGISLLFAPKAGKELREDIAQKADNLSKEIDAKIKQAEIDAKKIKGEEKDKRLAMIKRARQLKTSLDENTQRFSQSSKKITKVAAREADKLMQDGRVLLAEMESYGSIVAKDVKNYSAKAVKSGSKVAKTVKKETIRKTKSERG